VPNRELSNTNSDGGIDGSSSASAGSGSTRSVACSRLRGVQQRQKAHARVQQGALLMRAESARGTAERGRSTNNVRCPRARGGYARKGRATAAQAKRKRA
jgi:hypothetical protein